MSYVIGIDPAVKGGAFACVNEDGVLEFGWEEDSLSSFHELVTSVIRTRDWFGALEAIHIEQPRIYPGSRVRHMDLMRLTQAAGFISGSLSLYAPVTLIYPQQWKGNAPKSVTQARVCALYPDLDLSSIRQSKRHNVYDAVGIAHYAWTQVQRAA